MHARAEPRAWRDPGARRGCTSRWLKQDGYGADEDRKAIWAEEVRWSPVSKGNGEEARLVEEGGGRVRRCCGNLVRGTPGNQKKVSTQGATLVRIWKSVSGSEYLEVSIWKSDLEVSK